MANHESQSFIDAETGIKELKPKLLHALWEHYGIDPETEFTLDNKQLSVILATLGSLVSIFFAARIDAHKEKKKENFKAINQWVNALRASLGFYSESYLVECKPGIVEGYMGHVDTKRCGELALKTYKELQTALMKDGEFNLDDMMITMAMVVKNMGAVIDHDQENGNSWVTDAFPEFCSLIGPHSGIQVEPKTKEAVPS